MAASLLDVHVISLRQGVVWIPVLYAPTGGASVLRLGRKKQERTKQRRRRGVARGMEPGCSLEFMRGS
jgi:hypothetical protein